MVLNEQQLYLCFSLALNYRSLDNLPTDWHFPHNLPVTYDKHCSET
jgi:hypothetical protein